MNFKITELSRYSLEKVWRMAAPCIGVGLLLSGWTSNAQEKFSALTQPEVINVNDGRPLSSTLTRVEELYHFPIDYEEVPYENSKDLVSTSVSQNGVKAQTTAPRGGLLTVTLSPTTDPTPYLAVQSVLREYVNAGLAGQYRVDQSQDRLEVVPVRRSTSDGWQRDVTPVMSTPISFSSADRPVAVVFDILADKLSTAGVKVIVARQPFKDDATVELSADNEPARNVIANLGAKTGAQLSYTLLYDTNQKTYYLEIKFVPTNIKAGVARPAIRPKASQASSPWFQKR